MAKRPSNNGRSGAARNGSGRSAKSGPRTGSKANAARQSVAKARSTSSNSNRTQLLIGGVAIVLIVLVIVLGLVLNKKNYAVQGEGYGTAKASIATVSNGVVSIAKGDPKVTIELYEDALCPICGQFEVQYGQQVAKYTDDGSLRVNLHMLNFLNSESASKDYSTRAAGALLAVATEAGNQPGLVLKFHSVLFAQANQPTEGGSTDLTNVQLADLAIKAGVPESVRASISSGKYTQQAAANAELGAKTLTAAVGSVGTPAVLLNGKPVDIGNVNWLSTIVG